MSITISPLTSRIGAEVAGLDLRRPLDERTFATIHEAWMQHLVLVFRGEPLSDEQLVAFSARFGDLDHAPPNEAANRLGNAYRAERPEVTVISNVVVDGVPIGALGAGESEWHTDMSYMPVPPAASLLHALEIPHCGGDTWFCNMYAAYEALANDMRERVAKLVAIHDSSYTSAGDLRKGHEAVVDVSNAPGARHPVVRVHPVTGRVALFLGRRRNGYLLGMDIDESERLLDYLWAHATQDRFVYRHAWRVGDTLLWDNRCAMHRRDAFSGDARRVMHRTQVKGDVPVSRAA